MKYKTWYEVSVALNQLVDEAWPHYFPRCIRISSGKTFEGLGGLTTQGISADRVNIITSHGACPVEKWYGGFPHDLIFVKWGRR